MTIQPQTNLKKILPDIVNIAREAGDEILAVRKRTDTKMKVDYKSDKSPVSEADLASHNIITRALANISELPVLSEESAETSYELRKSWSEYWIIDPLDGTREFIENRDDFTVNIGLVLNHAPILGVIHVPATGESYYAAQGGGAYKSSPDGKAIRIKAREKPGSKPVVAVSLSHSNKTTEDFLHRLGEHELVRRGSILKSCMVAEGIADIYTRFGNTSEWDTAAGQCILEEAGGSMTYLDNTPLRYNSKESLLNPPFISAAPSAPDWQTIVKAMS